MPIDDSVASAAEDGLFGTYRTRSTFIGAQIGAVMLLLMTSAAVVLSLIGEIPTSSAVGALFIGVGGAALVWAAFVRPRFVVDVHGVEIVNPLRHCRLAWSDIERFDCEQQLLVAPLQGPTVAVAALPAPGLRRVLWGTPGRVDVFAQRLNAHLDELQHATGVRKPVIVETAEGRHNLRVVAALSTLGVLVVLALRIFVFHNF